MVVKVMHAVHADPRTIDRLCRHVYSATIAVVGAYMFAKIPSKRCPDPFADSEASSERTLFAAILGTIGILVLCGACTGMLAGFRLMGNCSSCFRRQRCLGEVSDQEATNDFKVEE